MHGTCAGWPAAFTGRAQRVQQKPSKCASWKVHSQVSGDDFTAFMTFAAAAAAVATAAATVSGSGLSSDGNAFVNAGQVFQLAHKFAVELEHGGVRQHLVVHCSRAVVPMINCAQSARPELAQAQRGRRHRVQQTSAINETITDPAFVSATRADRIAAVVPKGKCTAFRATPAAAAINAAPASTTLRVLCDQFLVGMRHAEIVPACKEVHHIWS